MSKAMSTAAKMFRSINSLGASVLGLVLDSGCLVCGARQPRASPLCKECMQTFKALGPHCCARCGRPFGDESVVEHSDSFVCGQCRTQKRYFDRAFSTFVYEGRLRDAILTFKYRRRFSLGHSLGQLWARYLPDQFHRYLGEDDGGSAYVVIPVPLHSERLMEREFNQSAILARFAARTLGLEVRYNTLKRIKPTEHQTGLSPRQRRLNVSGAFKVTRWGRVNDARILLVDDLFTTGATSNECAKVLKRAGAASVMVAALATPSYTQLGEEIGTEPTEQDGALT